MSENELQEKRHTVGTKKNSYNKNVTLFCYLSVIRKAVLV